MSAEPRTKRAIKRQRRSSRCRLRSWSRWRRAAFPGLTRNIKGLVAVCHPGLDVWDLSGQRLASPSRLQSQSAEKADGVIYLQTSPTVEVRRTIPSTALPCLSTAILPHSFIHSPTQHTDSLISLLHSIVHAFLRSLTDSILTSIYSLRKLLISIWYAPGAVWDARGTLENQLSPHLQTFASPEQALGSQGVREPGVKITVCKKMTDRADVYVALGLGDHRGNGDLWPERPEEAARP